MNDLTGYGKLDEFDFKKNKERLTIAQKELAKLTVTIVNEPVKMDLPDAHDLVKYAAENNAMETLRYRYRILHDLDVV
jgi:hypothetical protein